MAAKNQNKGTYDPTYYRRNANKFKESVTEYQAKLKSISIRVKPGLYDKIKEAVDVTGLSLRQFIIQALIEKISRDTGIDISEDDLT